MISEIVLDAKNYVENLLKDFEKQGYLFHNLNHTLEVYQRANYLGQKEGINDDLIEMLQLGTLFHDTGFVEIFEGNEKYGANIFEKWINQNYPDYPKDRIDIIKHIILATTVDIKPQNILEEIISDADLDSLGREDFFEKGILLKEEYQNMGGINYTDEQRNNRNYKLLNMVNYYTNTQTAERSSGFQKNLDILKKRLNIV